MATRRHTIDFFMLTSEHIPLAERFFSLVNEHPDLCVLPKETHYFSNVTTFAKGAAWYEEHFSSCEPPQKRGELSTSYLHTPGAASRIAQTYPDAALVIFVVDPLELMFSYYELASSTEKDAGFEAWLEKNPLVLETGKYGRALGNFYPYYSPVDCLVITLDEVRENAGKVITRVYDHLGVSTTFIPRVLRVLTEDEVKPGFWARRLRRRWREKRLRRARAQFPSAAGGLSDRERRLLAQYYDDDMTQLSALLHRDLRAEWGWPAR